MKAETNVATHTPGPWTYKGKSGDGKRQFVESDMKRDSWDCCRVEVDSDDCNYDMAVANARLIAAAPDLLSACESALRFHDAFSTHTAPRLLQACADKLRAALAKARGETSKPATRRYISSELLRTVKVGETWSLDDAGRCDNPEPADGLVEFDGFGMDGCWRWKHTSGRVFLFTEEQCCRLIYVLVPARAEGR